ncbi:cupin domain-containing protein [Alteromonas pelagimontana]|uniref:Cupin domain-containing protein n=1 Tax=Alteromonas pelagimontana TaxID=1858656 RepID=A0A6M4MGT3_9ALTE|nr:cupin domain-containing protein [Alteromonas pelagimontana]QJR82411.1 cupin domain-containing protein [Alteromonas pelagimontana]
MTFSLTNFSIHDFLSQHWQKKPAVFRHVFSPFVDPLDENDLAGIAMEEEADSRMVIQDAHGWHVEHGPFTETDFGELCRDKWTLLVQGVDKYLPDADALMEAFNFIPYWRMDDLMVSFASPGGGVGPHLDQYDVFLVQGKGKRRWQVGKPGEHIAQYPHPDLKQIQPFAAVMDVVLAPGDMLYIPPNWPHNGVAVDECMTYSVGFRAPDQAQIVQSLPEIFATASDTAIRYTDPALTAQSHPSLVSSTALLTLKSLLMDVLNGDQWQQAMLRLLSDQQLPESFPATLYQPETLNNALKAGAIFQRVPGCRPLFTPTNNSSIFTFFVNGELFTASRACESSVLAILSGEWVTSECISKCENKFALLEIVSTLINKGYWELHE